MISLFRLVADPLVLVITSLVAGQASALFWGCSEALWVLAGVGSALLLMRVRKIAVWSGPLIVFTIGVGQIHLLHREAPAEKQDSAHFYAEVLSWPTPGRPGELRVDLETADGRRLKCAIADLPWRNGSGLSPGQKFFAEAKIAPLKEDWRGRRAVRRGFRGQCSLRFLSPVSVHGAGFLSSVQIAVRSKLQGLTSQYQSGGIVRALLLGQRDGVTKQFEWLTRDLGIAHLFVVSGLHVGVLYGIVSSLIQLFLALLCIRIHWYGVPKIVGISAGLILVWFYVFILGTPLSATRAAIAISIVSVCTLFGRGSVGFIRGLLVSCFLLCSIWPGVFEELGFLLTYAALLGIWGAGMISNSSRFAEHSSLARWLIKAALFAVIPSFATGLLLLLYFGEFSLLAPFGNLFLTPIILGGGFLGGATAFALSFVFPTIAVQLMALIEWGLDLLANGLFLLTLSGGIEQVERLCVWLLFAFFFWGLLTFCPWRSMRCRAIRAFEDSA